VRFLGSGIWKLFPSKFQSTCIYFGRKFQSTRIYFGRKFQSTCDTSRWSKISVNSFIEISKFHGCGQLGEEGTWEAHVRVARQGGALALRRSVEAFEEQGAHARLQKACGEEGPVALPVENPMPVPGRSDRVGGTVRGEGVGTNAPAVWQAGDLRVLRYSVGPRAAPSRQRRRRAPRSRPEHVRQPVR
jgi:hypothetical protein